MAIAEQLAFSLTEERRGIHVLLWDDMTALFQMLLVTRAALGDLPVEPFLISEQEARFDLLKKTILSRISDQLDHEWESETDFPPLAPHPLWLLFIQQAASRHVGSRLNGWRSLLAEPFGTLIVVRNADFDEFQRSAPDLASFIGPRIYDASRTLMVCSSQTRGRLEKTLPEQFMEILRELPGALPSHQELRDWEPLVEEDEG